MNNILYYGGPILTMADPLYVEAVLIQKGKIVCCGPLEQVEAQADAETQRIDLQGRTLMPSFIDPHGHLSHVADAQAYADLSGCTTMEELGQRLVEWVRQNQVEKGRWVIGRGYDHNDLPGGQHPTAALLDAFLPDHPVLLSHTTGHMGVVNTRGLRELGISSDTPDPAGGHIGRDAQGCLTGYLEENALILRTRQIPRPTTEERLKNLAKAQQLYLSYGITTCQDGKVGAADFDFLCQAAKSGALQLDTVAYADMQNNEELLQEQASYRNYQRNLRLGGYKIFLDGSPQGRTAWMSKPYLGGRPDYRGYPIYTDDAVRQFCETALRNNVQLLAHCNGDAAAEQFIGAYEKALACSRSKNDVRPVMILAQTVRPEQLERMAKIHMLASFFVAHTYYWGDVHRKNFGDERAMRISPTQTALQAGVLFTFHQDPPVVLPDMWRTVWCAVNRLSKSGAVIGAEERISTLEALKAVTIHAAYQYFEENTKGSIEAGKLADLMIVDKDPLKTDPMDLCNIQVLETIKEGFSLYQKERA